MFYFVVNSRHGRLSGDYAQQRCFDVSDHYVFDQIEVHEDVSGTGGQNPRSFGINLLLLVCTPEPVELLRVEAEQRCQSVAEIHRCS